MAFYTDEKDYWWGTKWCSDYDQFPTGGTDPIEIHINNNTIHVTQEDKDKWNACVSGGTGGAKINDATIATTTTWSSSKINNTINQSTGVSKTYTDSAIDSLSGVTVSSLNGKQDTLVSGTNIKTVNNNTLLGSGNVSIRTFSDVPSYMNPYKTDTIENFLLKFSTDVKPEQGSAYLTGGILFSSGLPKSFINEYSQKGNCELAIYVPVSANNAKNIVYLLEISSTNCYTKLWYGGAGKWMSMWQVENGSVTKHMDWCGMLTCPQSENTIDGEYKYIPVKDSDGVSKYWMDKSLENKQDVLTAGNNIEISGNTISVVNVVSNSGGTINGDLTANAFYATSDIRNKKIVKELDLERCYEMIDKCSEIIYTLKNDETNKEQIGLIAQDVEEIFPELITENKEGFKTLDYSRIVVIILKVLKELLKERK